jgi:ATP-dependent helicase/nuclease subunit B
MKIILGFWLDSASYPDALRGQEASAGTVVTGFNGLLGILETQLGLTFPKQSENLRIAEWQELLRKHDNGTRLFSQSYQTDSWNTAKELLRRRDELVLAGWDPTIHIGGSKWLELLGELEQSNQNRTWGLPDRVRALLAKLDETVQLHIETITIVDEDETLWDPWCMQLIEKLKRHGVEIVKAPVEKVNKEEPTTDLSLLKSVLTGESLSQEAKGDGSLLLVRSEQEWDAADFLTSWLQVNATEQTVIIKDEGSLLLDELLHRRGVAGAGAEGASKWRAVLQVLPLTIDTYWNPIRVERMMELVTIPTSPIPGRIRYRLATALANHPGIGGPVWTEAIEQGLRHYEDTWSEEGFDEKEKKKRRKNLEEKLDLWVRHEYYDPNEGIPLETFVHICQKVSQWAATTYQRTNDPIYAQAIKHAQEVLDGVRTLGVTSVSQLQVGRIMDSVLGEGAKLSHYGEEAAEWQVVNHPGQIWGEADTILWWGFLKNRSGPSIRTWTAKERNWLKEQGVFLTEEDVRRRREAASWQKAIRYANRKLILFAPAKLKGEEIPIHPLWDEIRYAVVKDHHTEKKLTLDPVEFRKQPSVSLFEEQFERVGLNKRNIPEPIRTWQVPEKVVLPREEESATSFESLIGCPVKWTFRYAAKVKPASALSIPHESLMLGNLGHVILEHLITEKSSWSEQEVQLKAGELFDELMPKLAAPLLEPKNSILRNETRRHLQTSLQQFFKVLNQAGVQIQHTELDLQKPWSEGVEFKGRLDLVGETRTGKKILFDAKWSRKPSNYKERLEKVSIQLTLYHWLLADHEDEELPVAYFMLRSGHFYSLPHEDFPEDYHVPGPSLLENHGMVRKSVEDVWVQLQQGTITAPGVPSKASQEEGSFSSIIDPPCMFCEYQNLCGVRRLMT